MELEELQRETRSSIEIDQNAKGDWSLKAKAYYDESDPVGRVQAQERLEAINKWFQSTLRRTTMALLPPGQTDPGRRLTLAPVNRETGEIG